MRQGALKVWAECARDGREVACDGGRDELTRVQVDRADEAGASWRSGVEVVGCFDVRPDQGVNEVREGWFA